ncbi:MAG: hypothetical protein ACT4P7_16740 [Gemmatimonadaceae bacterium]
MSDIPSISMPGREDLQALRAALDVLRPRLRVVTAVGCAAALLAGAWRVTRSRDWASETSLVPVSSGAPSSLSGVAAQFGINVPGADPTQSPAFYVDLLRSRELLEQLAADGPMPPAAPVKSSALAARLGVEDATGALGAEMLFLHLRDHIDASADPKTGIVRLRVTAPEPALAAGLAHRMLQLAEKFNLGRRQTRAGAERRFADRRLDESKADLHDRENRLRDFRLRNRIFRNAPTLELEQSRLEREVAQAQQVVLLLTQASEQASLDEARDVPVFTVVQRPTVPVLPESRGTVLWALLALIAGTAGSAAAIVARAAWSRTTRSPRETPVPPRSLDRGPAEEAA